LNRDEWGQILAFTMQELNTLDHAPRREVSASEGADLDASGEAIL
jgi:hypothetical protein